MIFREDENLKKIFIANVNVYRYSNLIIHLMSPFCFYSKNGVGVQNDSYWKTATTI